MAPNSVKFCEKAVDESKRMNASWRNAIPSDSSVAAGGAEPERGVRLKHTYEIV